MISDVDLRDWEKLDHKKIRDMLKEVDNGSYYFDVLRGYVDSVEAIMKKQVPQVAVLLKGD